MISAPPPSLIAAWASISPLSDFLTKESANFLDVTARIANAPVVVAVPRPSANVAKIPGPTNPNIQEKNKRRSANQIKLIIILKKQKIMP